MFKNRHGQLFSFVKRGGKQLLFKTKYCVYSWCATRWFFGHFLACTAHNIRWRSLKWYETIPYSVFKYITFSASSRLFRNLVIHHWNRVHAVTWNYNPWRINCDCEWVIIINVIVVFILVLVFILLLLIVVFFEELPLQSISSCRMEIRVEKKREKKDSHKNCGRPNKRSVSMWARTNKYNWTQHWSTTFEYAWRCRIDQ